MMRRNTPSAASTRAASRDATLWWWPVASPYARIRRPSSGVAGRPSGIAATGTSRTSPCRTISYTSLDDLMVPVDWIVSAQKVTDPIEIVLGPSDTVGSHTRRSSSALVLDLVLEADQAPELFGFVRIPAQRLEQVSGHQVICVSRSQPADVRCCGIVGRDACMDREQQRGVVMLACERRPALSQELLGSGKEDGGGCGIRSDTFPSRALRQTNSTDSAAIRAQSPLRAPHFGPSP